MGLRETGHSTQESDKGECEMTAELQAWRATSQDRTGRWRALGGEACGEMYLKAIGERQKN